MKNIPANAEISRMVEGAYYVDCFVVPIQNEGQSAMHLWLAMIKNTPRWINALMFVRNKIAPLFGFKDMGSIDDVIATKQAQDYIKNDRVGIFSLFYSQKNEVIMQDTDAHLTVKISLFLEPVEDSLTVSLSTVVHAHSRLGKLYMKVIGVMNKMVIRAALAQLKKA